MRDGDEKLGLELRLVKAGESLPGGRRLKMCGGQTPIKRVSRKYSRVRTGSDVGFV
jgi:hypothetical protein